MADRIRVQLPMWEIYLNLTNHPGQLNLDEYQPKGGDALHLGSKGMYGSCLLAGKTV